MHRAASLLSALAAVAVVPTIATNWGLTTKITPNTWSQNFNFYSGPDNFTNGLVVYQSEAAAKNMGIAGVVNGEYRMAVSTQAVALEGRPSVRVESKQRFGDGVYVLNVSHVPTGCSTWPAFWTTTTEENGKWPIGGEIDILENANDEFTSNLVSLHTKSDCQIPAKISGQTGSVDYTTCSVYVNNNSGCRVRMNGGSAPTWGASFNRAKGGFFAMARSFGSTGKGVRVWYWPRGSEPADLKASSKTVNPDAWGKPAAWFNIANSCRSDFGPHKIVFDITLGGDWAFNTYVSSGCAAKYGNRPITDQVAYNGTSYNKAYWSVGGVRVFATGGGTDNAASLSKKRSGVELQREA
ncbi:hypothetical protein IE81DRAFT_325058 [Ceraceosorus guamensis]|uniref:GH16 domain-containing protein n=1 Tax=Ceraceosorus guamensis TaxID=1522189 RepID=A0A316VVJ9_9BASI|nr:hypothetical protein IE81DRAFT_325058 [Ceraceosorus guamensis]PWN40968.1 hypothetical protein IE81DRAFT_325058 [Ceraceosorus guamensis]